LFVFGCGGNQGDAAAETSRSAVAKKLWSWLKCVCAFGLQAKSVNLGHAEAGH